MSSKDKQKLPSKYDQYQQEVENISKQSRHGVFSQPPPLCIGDKFDDALKSEGNKKKILINPKIKKFHEPALFQDPQFITINDPYKETFKLKQQEEKEKVMAIPHDQPFKPTNVKKTQTGSEFKHFKEFNEKKFNRRFSAGKVVTESRNFFTNPGKRGLGSTTYGHTFQPLTYMADPYDRFEEQERRERILHRSKFLHQKKGFYTTTHGNRPFTANNEIYDGAGYNPIQRPQSEQIPFRPSNPNKKGYNGCFERLEYLEEGTVVPNIKRNAFQRLSQTSASGKPWKPNQRDLPSKPQPSINQSYQNRVHSPSKYI